MLGFSLHYPSSDTWFSNCIQIYPNAPSYSSICFQFTLKQVPSKLNPQGLLHSHTWFFVTTSLVLFFNWTRVRATLWVVFYVILPCVRDIVISCFIFRLMVVIYVVIHFFLLWILVFNLVLLHGYDADECCYRFSRAFVQQWWLYCISWCWTRCKFTGLVPG